jgi:hypothetical protein
MISAAKEFATPELGESSASNDRPASEERSPNNSSLTANNQTTAINPASPAHSAKRGQAVVECSCVGNSVGAYLLQRRPDFHIVFSFEISDAS